MSDTLIASSGRGANKIARLFSVDGQSWEPRVMAGVKHVRLHFKEADYTLDMSLADLSEEMLHQAAAFGLNTTVGNQAGGAADEDEAITACEDRWKDIVGGRWGGERSSGPRGGDLLEAFVRVYRAAGVEYPEAEKAKLFAGLADKSLSAKKILSDARLRAAYEGIKAERIAARRAATAKAAEALAGAALPTL